VSEANYCLNNFIQAILSRRRVWERQSRIKNLRYQSLHAASKVSWVSCLTTTDDGTAVRENTDCF